ncbi:DNA topoisomerase VI subunit B [Thermoplasmatales archaeon ex4572_165]|nr:MAG: DNA topoisomerase VI subunit B [Thermoplasmatales archaeon ex4572_165]RLF58947.1 MAG: DNA topoisomerase VI subunit B [Thermoplasmata archaeon]
MAKITAHDLAKKQKEISVAEFFERNKHILGFGNQTRALVTSVKEAVDNSLDACEEVGILPDISVSIQNNEEDEECILIIEDNGPGIVKEQIKHIFGRLLYGSRFHAIRQSRGQQGIGISAVVLYGQLTTGKHALVTSKISEEMPAVILEIAINTKRNRAETVSSTTTHWDKTSGTRFEIPLKADYVRGKRFIYDYLKNTSIVNPHAQITFNESDGKTHVFERTSEVVPKESTEIKPHPYGIELGTLIKMGSASTSRKLSSFLKTDFTSMGNRTIKLVLEKSELKDDLIPKKMKRKDFLSLHKAFKKVKIMSPPTDCLSPIGETLIRRSLKHETQEISPEFIITSSRPATAYSGNPFQVEVGLVYGGNLPKDSQVKIMRFANRVPLLYQQGGCAITRAISSIDWRHYGLDQKAGKGIPTGPGIIMVHVASTQIPFTSESKEAIADIDEIENEIKLALRSCARNVQRHIRKKVRRKKTKDKFVLITKILPEISKKSSKMIGKPQPMLDGVITKIMDVIWIEDLIEYETVKGRPVQTTLNNPDPTNNKGGVITKSLIRIANYKEKPQKFSLIALIPEDAVVGEVNPTPVKMTDHYLKWDLEAIPPAQKKDVIFELAGLQKNDFDVNDLYVQDINPAYIIGAEKWEGE